ncbi:MAG TPA: multifunctional CCA addition/repair protein [Steroidobacteraceae bacterium]|nr:multifunctional CCA addition/repair protein [Steroidobacteraceae bacterium]
MQVYLVGGAVRDELLGRKARERDWVVVGSTPEEMAKLGYRLVGRDFPVFLHPRTHEEYALARRERKIAPGYRGFTTEFDPNVTLEEDLLRRDLTINAMARTEDGTLIDPHGGARDLEARLLRHVSPAFIEDPVRVLRVARFAARYAGLGFRVADETLTLMSEMVAKGEVSALVAERVWQETARALEEDAPQTYFEVLRDCGALAVVFPELDALWGVPQPERWHPEIDTGVHTLMAVEMAARLSPDVRVRFATLVHDLGKADTPRERWPSHPGHEELSVKRIDELCDRLRVPNEHRELAIQVARHHGNVHRAAELRPGTVLELLEKTDALRRPERFELILTACEADARGRLGLEGRDYSQAQLLRDALAAARAIVPNEEELAAGGAAIAQRLRQRRVAAIARLKDSRDTGTR